MTLAEFFFATPNLPFAVAIGAFLSLALLELIMMAMGHSSSAIGVDHDVDIPDGHVPQVLEWLNVGTVPTLIYLTLCTFGFGVAGYLVQWFAVQFKFELLHLPVASLIALLCMVPFVKGSSGLLRRTILRDETDVSTEDALTGRLGVITLGSTSAGKPSQAKVTDKFGQVQYVLVEPLFEDASFETGDEVVLVERHGAMFRVIGRDDNLADVTDRLMRRAETSS